MPAADDPYDVLGVLHDASPAEITAAYRRLARQHHPDVAPGTGDGARMAAINRAYALLRDPRRRQTVDERLASGAPPAPPPPPPPDAAPEEGLPAWEDADLETYYEDWRQVYEEERRLWEWLLAARGPDSAEHDHLARQVAHAREVQRAFENAHRARRAQPPLDEAAWEDLRSREQGLAAARGAAAGGCLGMLALVGALGLATRLRPPRWEAR